MTTTTEVPKGSKINSSQLIKDLATVSGIVTESGEDTFEFQKSWFADPLKSFEDIPNDPDRRKALVNIFSDIWDNRSAESPLQQSDGKADENKWFAIPKSLQNPDEESGLYFVPEAEADEAVFGLGLMHETKVETGSFSFKPFAFFPILSLPFENGSPVIFGKDNHPIPVGVELRFPENSVSYNGNEYNGFKVIANFNVANPTSTKVDIFLAQKEGSFDPLSIDFSSLTSIINAILKFDKIKEWLDTPIVSDNPNKTGLGSILTALKLLNKDEGGNYSLGTLDLIKNLTFEKLIHVALNLLNGLQILKLGEKGKEGLFIVKTTNEETKVDDFGFRFVLTDIDLTSKNGDESGGEEDESANKDEEEGDTNKEEEKGNKLFLQLGKSFEPDPKKEGGGDKEKAEAEEESGEEKGNWTQSEKPLGINLFIVSASEDDSLTFNPELDLVSIGLDYVGPEGKPIMESGGFSFTGVEPRIFLSLKPLAEEDKIQFGAALRIDHIEIPLDAPLKSDSDSSNPVANNLLKSNDEGEEKEATGEKTTPAARTEFSFSAAYTPIVKEGSSQHHFNVELYDKDNKATTKPIWWQLQKSFGPVAIQKVGIAWDNAPRNLEFLLNGGLDLAGLSVELDELSVTFQLQKLDAPELDLKGMSLTYESGGVEISGGFLKVKGDGGIVEYDGEATIVAEGFGLSAVGSYASVNDHPSLFIFALLDIPLGGPPFFFVTGVAAGFGFNRSLKIPTLDNLPTFPLVSAAMAGQTGSNPFKDKEGDPGAALQVLHKYIPPDYGEYWLAAGIRFTSFELIQSFALLTVSFGNRFEIDLLGLSSVAMPPNLPEGKEPIAFAELALEVTFSPDKGILGISAKLTDQSYIFSKACHLTGGFAFFTWFKNNPQNDPKNYQAGDFVITLGGYNSHYNKPAFFPDEPRVGFNWKIGKNLNIQGGIYFALTPSAVMAGGLLSAVWQSGGLRAWFDLYADFLLSWKPFFYYIDAGIHIGISLSIKILFIHIRITIHVGVDIAVWGPSFGGKAKIDLSIITFTIHFGSEKPDVQPIGWDEFKTSFLPPAQSDDEAGKETEAKALIASSFLAMPMGAASNPTAISTNAIVASRAGGPGLVKDFTSDKDNDTGLSWVLKPNGFEIITHTSIPATQAELVTGSKEEQAQTINLVETKGLNPSPVDIGPSDIPSSSLRTDHTIYLFKIEAGPDQAPFDFDPDLAFDFSEHAEITPVFSASPQATWNKDIALNPELSKVNGKPLNISGTLVGFSLKGKIITPDTLPPIDISHLQYEYASEKPKFDWSHPQVKTVDPDPGKNGTEELMATINDPVVASKRSSILGAIAGLGMEVATDVEVDDLAASADHVLLDSPSLISWQEA